jgi:serine/threonine-protein kinase
MGTGGMGEVYRARDTRLKRDVALKVLPETLDGDPDRVARFQREAELLATLAHPNIAAIFGLEESAVSGVAVRALVMELVSGETLDARIARGPMPVDDALGRARQLVEALDYAHEHGVVHRDLKPANIMVTPDGQVKVLDFGLAKAMEPGLRAEAAAKAGVGRREPGVGIALANSPTIASPAHLRQGYGGQAMTQVGSLLGTAAYMAPEQARGQLVDKRADIWAFGCVLYEMVAGTRAFEGDTISDILAAVLRSDPDFDRMPATVPGHVRGLIAQCLQKDPKRRLRDIGDARLRLDVVPTDANATTPTTAVPLWRRLAPWAVAVAGLLIGASALLPRPAQDRAAAPLMRIDASLGADATIEGDIGPAAVLSPDGSLLVFVARPRDRAPHLYVRRIAELQAVELAGTEGARDPFFSPDGQWVGFLASGKLKKVAVTGGTVVTLCDASNTRGAWWSDDGRIIFNPVPAGGVPLHVVSSAGGVPEPLTTLADGEATQRWPQLIRDGQAVLYTTSKNLGRYDDGEVVVQRLPGGPRQALVRGYHGRYVPSGHLIFVREGRLFAAAFDVERLELTGSPVPVLEEVRTGPTTGGVQFAFSNTGTAVYRVGAGVARPMAWIDRAGTSSPLPFAAADWGNLRFSPDGQRLALDMRDGQQTDIRVYDWARNSLTQLSFDPSEDWSPAWTPDGLGVVFRSARDRAFNLYWQRADGSGSAVRLTTSPNPQIAYSWHPAGKLLAYVETFPSTNTDIMLLPVDGATGRTLGPPTVFLNTPASEGTPSFSPDGKWIAYTSTDAGRTNVYVRPFPGPGGLWLIAADGLHPTWSSRRRELLFFGPDQRVMVSTYTIEGDRFRHDPARPWSPARLHTSTRGLGGGIDGIAFALHPDGDRIVGAVLSDVESAASDNRVVLLVNFFDELRRVAVPRN